MKNNIDVELARERFGYDKETGVLSKISGRAPRNGKLGTIDKSGTKISPKHYMRVSLDGKLVYAHRLIWVIVTGEQPDEVDHIDGNGLNNKWENLRSVSHSVNGRNQKLNSRSTSGVAGVYHRKESGRWRAQITVEGITSWIGTFDHKYQAIQARRSAEYQHGFLQFAAGSL